MNRLSPTPAARPTIPSQMYAGNRCRHHGCPTRPVGRPGSPEERQQCDHCEDEFQAALTCLVAA